MKIKNLKYLFVLVPILLVSSSAVFGAGGASCTPPALPTLCSNINGGSAAYNNNASIGGTSLVFLKMFNLPDIKCGEDIGVSPNQAGENVRTIQNKLNAVCNSDLCPDGRYGQSTDVALAGCAATYCRNQNSDYIPKTWNGTELVCGDGYSPEGLCCKPASDPEPEPEVCEHQPVNGACSDSGYILSGDCCVFDCSQGNSCSTGETWSVDSCKCVCNPNLKCCGIQLNTVVPFIGNCIEMNAESSMDTTTSVNSVTAFPILMQGLMKILMSVIMIFSFLMVIVSGLMMTAGAFKSSSFDKGKTILKNVLISLILLGCSGLILSLINPSFFGG